MMRQSVRSAKALFVRGSSGFASLFTLLCFSLVFAARASAAPGAALSLPESSSYARRPDPGARYLIFSADTFADIVQPLVEWKTKKGMPARVVRVPSEVPNDPDTIRGYVLNAWNNWSARLEQAPSVRARTQAGGWTRRGGR
jgi:hypothetical protein